MRQYATLPARVNDRYEVSSHPDLGEDCRRRATRAAESPFLTLHLRLFRQLQGVIDIDSQIPDGAFELGMSEKQLNSPDVLRSPVDEGSFRPAHRVSSIKAWI